jgi:hypothetical protein
MRTRERVKIDNARKQRIEEYKREAQDALRDNICPVCGGPVRENLSILGWIQCAQFGAEGFRLDSTKPSCNFQGFTS